MEYERNSPLGLVAVTPSALQSVAGEIEQVETDYAAAQAPLMEDLRAAENQFSGWWLGRVFGQLDGWWARDFRTFDANLRAVADHLGQAAEAYRAGDEVNASMFWYLR